MNFDAFIVISSSPSREMLAENSSFKRSISQGAEHDLAAGGHRMELVGELAAILSFLEGARAIPSVHGPDMTKPPLLARVGSKSVSLVAGAGFEPAT
ncbi:hypothetical protein, partial [Paracoccus laeviglucosivorans]|uniref:hypothetical protein n=1 Tax=Paracoccus laeviglucosivorans TaxID=1197861 RepID=UPI001C8F851B